MKNWKTTIAAILVVLPQILEIVFPEIINSKYAIALSLLFGALGLGAAKDFNVTGGTVANTVNDASIVKETTKVDKP